MTESFLDEKQMQFRLNQVQAGYLDSINIVPAFPVEGVVHNGIAQNVDDLAFCHARFQLVDHRLCDDVTLLNGKAVNTRKSNRGAGADEYHQGENDEDFVFQMVHKAKFYFLQLRELVFQLWI